MKKLPFGIQAFKKIREADALYVDKTENIYQLINKVNSYYFISRPRRFGKSLLISTLEEIFSGNQELFKDLWIYDKIDWEKFPVIKVDFSSLSFMTPEDLKRSLNSRLIEFLEEYLGIFIR